MQYDLHRKYKFSCVSELVKFKLMHDFSDFVSTQTPEIPYPETHFCSTHNPDGYFQHLASHPNSQSWISLPVCLTIPNPGFQIGQIKASLFVKWQSFSSKQFILGPCETHFTCNLPKPLFFCSSIFFPTEPNDESGANVDASVSINPKH